MDKVEVGICGVLGQIRYKSRGHVRTSAWKGKERTVAERNGGARGRGIVYAYGLGEGCLCKAPSVQATSAGKGWSGEKVGAPG